MAAKTGSWIGQILIETKRELAKRYSDTAKGVFWLIVCPLLQTAIIGFILPLIMKRPVEHYNYFLITELLVWNFLSLTISEIAAMPRQEHGKRGMAFVPEGFFGIILSETTNLLIAQTLCLVPLVYLGTLRLSSIPAVLLGYVMLLTLVIGLSLLIVNSTDRHTGLKIFIPSGLLIWFLTSPVMYPFEIIPETYYWIWRLNPIAAVLQLFARAFVGYPPPGSAMMAANGFLILMIFLLGLATGVEKKRISRKNGK